MILPDEEATRRADARLADAARAGDVVALSGELGAGKTMFARGFLEGLGHDGEVPSPTFAIVQPYEALEPPVWHADLYRLESSAELDELGLEVSEEGVLLVEWPERAGQRWPEALHITLTREPDGARSLTAVVPPSWEGRWPFQ